MPAYALTIFTGAFLLFQAQPLIGKYILPWFGGAPGTWTTCLLFFQVLLLGGYAYAYASTRWLQLRAQALWHLLLLLAALALLPITPADSWKPDGSGHPTLQILGILLRCLGLPYFVLASTSPLLQHWFSRAHPDASPYRLYALSNVGSLLALVSFPFFFETHFPRTTQAMIWGWGLVIYAGASAYCAIKLWQNTDRATPAVAATAQKSKADKPKLPPEIRPSKLDRRLWLLLPACASVLLLATTNKICQEVAVIPFLWVLPLSLYLLSFILCFDNPRWYMRRPFIVLFTVVSGGICWMLFAGPTTPIRLQLSIYSAGLFIACMVCHGELYRLKPAPRHLTGFYLMIAAGGALGGLFVAVVAPLIFTDYYELHWGLMLCGLLLLIVCARQWPPGTPKPWRLLTCAWLSAGLVALGIALSREAHRESPLTVSKLRNFYGVLKITRSGDNEPEPQRYLQLIHGHITHGLQFVEPPRATWPTTYYNEKSGVGRALQSLPAGEHHIGLVGLGIGTLAAYAQPGDRIRAYEINPEVLRLATTRFTFLSNCLGKVELVLGDARLSMEQEPPQNFDLLALDAFSSDAIPVHLLTREAFLIYGRHLKSNGIIAVHISNRSMDLEPVVAHLAQDLNYQTVTVEHLAPPGQWWIGNSIWMLLSRGSNSLASPAIRVAARPTQTDWEKIPLWTDDFTSLFQILRPKQAQVNPDSAETHYNLANALLQKGQIAEAIAQFQKALHIEPDYPEAQNDLAWELATTAQASLRNGAQAVQLAEKANQFAGGRNADFLDTLAAAYAEAGRFDDAIRSAQKAIELARAAGQQNRIEQFNRELRLYEAGRPFHRESK